MCIRDRLLALAKLEERGVEVRVHPTLIPESRLVANVSGPMNAVLVKGNMVGPTLYYGAGAGAEPTASAVVADIIDIARQSQISNKPFIPSLGFMSNQIKEKEILSIDDINSEFYLRLSMKNQAGSLAKITKIFASHNISIDAMTQKVEHNQSIDPDIFLVTSKTKESIVNEIIEEIEAFPDNNHKIIKLRIEELT